MDPQDLISLLLGERMTPNDYVARNFPQMRYDPNYLPNSPMSENIIDRRQGFVSPEDIYPQEYIEQAFEELKGQ